MNKKLYVIKYRMWLVILKKYFCIPKYKYNFF